MKTIRHLLLLIALGACAQAQTTPTSAVMKNSGTKNLTDDFNTGAKTVKVSNGGTLHYEAGASLAGDLAELRGDLGLGSLATQSAVTSALITDGTIVNADVSNSAGIVLSKLAITGTPDGSKFLRDDGSWQVIDLSAYQPLNAKLTAIGGLANAAGVLTNNGSGTFSYTATSAGGNDTDDAGKLVTFDSNGAVVVSNALTVSGGPSDYIQVGDDKFSYTTGGFNTELVFDAPTANRGIHLPDRSGTVITDGDSGTVTDTMLAGSIANAKLSNSAITIAGASTSLGGSITASTILDSITTTRGAIPYRGASGWAAASPGTSGHVWTSNGTGADPTWQAAAGGGITIGSTAITGGTSGRLMTSGSTVGELTLGSNVGTLLTTFNKSNANNALSDDNFAFLGAANGFTETQTVTKTGPTQADPHLKMVGYGGNITIYDDDGTTVRAYTSAGRWFARDYNDGSQTMSMGRDGVGGIGMGINSQLHFSTDSVWYGTQGPQWGIGSGSPEGVVTAKVGSLYTRIDGGAGTTLYVKESGTGNTGWVAK